MRVLLITVCFAFTTANAAEIHLRDGSVVMGNILSLQDSEDLVVDTEYMDEVIIEWEAITVVRETQVIEVELFNGERIFGEVVVDEKGVSIIGAETTVTLPRDRIFSIAQVSESFWEGIDVYTDVGMNIVRGNNEVTQLSFGAGIGYDGVNFESSLDATTIINEQTEGQDLRRATLAGSYAYRLPRNWQVSGLLQFESDDQQGLILPSLEQSDRVRMQFDASLSVDLFADLDFKLTVYDRYDSQPPEGNDTNDSGLTLGLSWSY